MDFKSPYRQLFVYAVLACVFVGTSTWSYEQGRPLTALLLMLLAMVALVHMWRVLGRIERRWWLLFDAWEAGEPRRPAAFQRYYAKAHDRWLASMAALQQQQEKQEARQLFLETLLANIEVGLVVLRPDGSIYWHNPAAMRWLQLPPAARHVQQLPPAWEAWKQWVLQAAHHEERLFEIAMDHSLMSFASKVSRFAVLGEAFIAVGIQNLQHLMEDKEMMAWQQLTRVLTHEISNSVTPIASILSSVRELMQAEALTAEDHAEIQQALALVERRAQDLIHFVQEFRNLTKMPEPNRRWVQVRQLFEEVAQLMQQEAEAIQASIEIRVEPAHMQLWADRGLLMQVLINLCKNALHALAETERVRKLQLTAVEGERYLAVEDNGTGISPEAMRRLFVPFFSTKKKGSGIGLSLSRQIVRAHGWRLRVQSEWGKGTRIRIDF
ncbi:sensor histidine kinase [Thermonema rossianum]|uniref:sensor histidine kinase n=1 Tax=Thermonema rossianum TaxID=55505 RepID=UPI00057202CD|nr:ATP-binding protein [Thermonema rossianum]